MFDRKTERPPNPVPIQIPDEDLIPTRDVPALSSSYTRSSNMESLAANFLLKGRPKSTTPEDDEKRTLKSKLEDDVSHFYGNSLISGLA